MHFLPKESKKFLVSILVVIIGMALGTQCFCQSNRTEGDMHESKWWLGLKSGMNFIQVRSLADYSILARGNESINLKSYEGPLKNTGGQIGITAGHAFTSFLAVTIQPAIFFNKYNYSTSYTWFDTLGNETKLKFQFRQTLYYLDLPLLARIGWKVGRFQVFAQGGGFYNILLNAHKKYTISEDNILAGTAYDSKESEKIINNKSSHIKSMLGLIAGGGLAYDIEWFRIGLDVNYRSGLSNITNVKNRFDDNLLSAAAYDVADDLKLNSLEISLSCMVPLDNLVHVTKSTRPKKLSKPGK